MSDNHQITIDQSAIDRISALRNGENGAFGKKDYLRIAVDGGGCSGFQYRMEPADAPAEDDTVFADMVVIDEISIQFIKGSTVKFQDDMMGAMFVIDNPNASSSCGCQTSFSVNPENL